MVSGDTAVSVIGRLIRMDQDFPKRILVIGEAMTDIYVHGREEACQEGCIKFIELSRVKVPGGAANAARSLTHWNAKIVTAFSGHPVPVKTRFMVGDRCAFRHDDDRNHDANDFDHARKSAMASLLSWHPDGVLISDYDKGFLTREFIAEVTSFCNKRAIPCVADAKRGTDTYAGAIIKGNFDWYVKGGSASVITQGAQPPRVEGWSLDCDLPPVRCVNHVGAGDCFAAHLVLTLSHGISLREAAAIAHSAGRVYVQKHHNAPPRPSEIRADMECARVVV